MRFQGKKALVTGAAGGIGKSLVRKLRAEGASVAITDITIGNVEAEAHFPGDLSAAQFCDELPRTATDALGGLDILINNAGITGPTATLWEYDIEMWKKVVEINLMGTFNCCRSIVPNMIKNNYGRIVNVASVAGKDGNANASAYSVGKAGAIGLTKSLGKELADKNIAVNAVTPAGAKTRILDQMTKEHVQRMLSKVPRGRFLEVEEFTSLICWLSSEENTFSTAAVFDISGGRSTY